MPLGYDAKKAAQVVAFLVLEQGGKADMIKTVKLAYMSDRKFLDEFERPILSDDFYCLDHGPIDSYTLDLIKGKASKIDQGIWNEYLTPVNKGNWKFAVRSKELYLGELNTIEEDVMRSTVKRFKHLGGFELVDWIHSHCREWSNPRGTSNYLSYTDVFKALGKNDPTSSAENVDRFRSFKEQLKSAA